MSPAVLLLLRRPGDAAGIVAERLREAGAIVLTDAFFESPIDALAHTKPALVAVEAGHAALDTPEFLDQLVRAGADLVRIELDGQVARVAAPADRRADSRELADLVAERGRPRASRWRTPDARTRR